MNQENRLQNGIELIKAIFNLSLACIENNVMVFPDEINELLKNRNSEFLAKNETSIFNHNLCIGNFEDFSVKNTKITHDELYQKYLTYQLSSSITFKEILAICFHVNIEDFEFKVFKNNIVKIYPSKLCKDEFIIDNYLKISNEITSENKKYNLLKKEAKKNKERKVLESCRGTEIKKIVIKKERFTV
ncbi:hypothetical protein [Candidatus Deianiraea vastatrix]|uniref:Uncharacterized protein n=1 Tax=Candidatus Deianiraea vastatrix TaxID=2163644 RepID=A0A5B8XCA1_9RICK|nr:hypothetical protein [Candidatus Deianiraea vastatrix]QED22969.1 hypothetical protein Deia_00159 [Candidatus Deianiraea vastatrix]